MAVATLGWVGLVWFVVVQYESTNLSINYGYVFFLGSGFWVLGFGLRIKINDRIYPSTLRSMMIAI